MKKLVTILLSLLIIYNSCGYVIIHFQLKSIFKEEALTRINTNFQNQYYIEVFTFKKNEIQNSIKFVEDNEFVYKNEMYDIIKTEENNENITYFVIWDENETKLNQVFCEYFNKSIDKNISDSSPIRNIVKSFITTITLPENYNYKFNDIFLTEIFLSNIDTPSQYCLKPLSPPPKNNYFSII